MAMLHSAARLTHSLEFVEPLAMLAEALLRAAQNIPEPRRTRRGATLRPGARTPLWNALVHLVQPHLHRYGAKSQLGRILGVPPQRVHAYFVSRTQSPDAERTLLLLTWLAQRKTPGTSG